MPQPQGFEDRLRPQHVCQLRKALYGLKQAPRAWYEQLRLTLLQWHFIQSKVDPSLFLFQARSQFVIILVYVDDILLTRSSPNLLNRLVSQLHHKFVIRDLGDIYYFLGIQVHRNTNGFHLSQTTYV